MLRNSNSTLFPSSSTVSIQKRGPCFCTSGQDKIVCVWSFPAGELLGSYKGHNGAVHLARADTVKPNRCEGNRCEPAIRHHSFSVCLDLSNSNGLQPDSDVLHPDINVPARSGAVVPPLTPGCACWGDSGAPTKLGYTRCHAATLRHGCAELPAGFEGNTFHPFHEKTPSDELVLDPPFGGSLVLIAQHPARRHVLLAGGS